MSAMTDSHIDSRPQERQFSVSLEFNDNCRIEERPLSAGASVVVVDDALLDPEQLARVASAQMPNMVPDSRWQYPGIELPLPEDSIEPVSRFLRRHLRGYFDLSRVVRESYARFSMVTVPPEQLSWMQRMCHVDVSRPNPGERVIASVLYLFHDSDLGGTAFFRPRPDVPPYMQLLRNGSPGPGSDAYEFFHQAPAYHTGSNEFYELDEVVEARWNRIIFYRGDVHHSAHITAPERLSADPRKGRLTLNGFYRVAALVP